jgi:hypothetical protein
MVPSKMHSLLRRISWIPASWLESGQSASCILYILKIG